MYHSAMKKYGGVAKSNDSFDGGIYSDDRISVLQHDICEKIIPEIFFNADVVFTVMAWRNGYKKFVQETVAKNTTFNQYCEGIKWTIQNLRKPAFVITNKNFVSLLGADRVEPIIFDRFNSNDLCAIWNYDGPIPESTTKLMQWIGRNYQTVLDFCCGYGEITEYCQSCILSDVNTGCIDYIRKYLLK